MVNREHRLAYGGTALDFTTWRKGRKWRGNPVDVCPKCGRKGVRRPIELRPGFPTWHFDHWAEDAGVIYTRDFCMVLAPGHPDYQATRVPGTGEEEA